MCTQHPESVFKVCPEEERFLKPRCYYSSKKDPLCNPFSIKLSHYLLVPLPLLLKLPLTWYRYSDFLQGNEPIPRPYQKAGSALSGPIHKQAGRPQRRLAHHHFAAAQPALPRPTKTNKQWRKGYLNY